MGRPCNVSRDAHRLAGSSYIGQDAGQQDHASDDRRVEATEAGEQPRFESNLRSPRPRPRRSRLMVKDVGPPGHYMKRAWAETLGCSGWNWGVAIHAIQPLKSSCAVERSERAATHRNRRIDGCDRQLNENHGIAALGCLHSCDITA